jgi:putative ABC transport system permease protein
MSSPKIGNDRHKTSLTAKRPHRKISAMLKNYFKMAWRNITRHKVYTFINILGLSLGLVTCLAIFLLSHFELSTDSFHPDHQRIYRLISKEQRPDFTFLQGAVPPITALEVRQAIPGLEAIAAWHRYEAHVQPVGNDKPAAGEKVILAPATIIAEPQYFSIFAYRWLAGSPVTALNAPLKVVLTQSRARIYFGNIPPEKTLGRVLVYNDSLRLTVSGVVEDWRENSDFLYTDFISFSTINASFLRHKINLDQWGGPDIPRTSVAFVKLAKNVDPAQVDRQLATLSRGHIHFDDGNTFTLKLQPLADIHYNKDVYDYFPKAHLPTLYALMGIAAFILLLAIINFINLSTAMAIRRAKEVGVRKVLGSGRLAIILQFLAETAMITGCALVIAMLAVQPIIALFHSFLPSALEFHPFTPSVLLFLLGITVLTTLLSGLYPARVLSAWLPVLCLKGAGAPSTPNEKGGLRKSLIVFQFTISLLFIICTLVIGRQINYMRTQDLGFSTEAILNINTNPGDTTQKPVRLALLIKQIPGVDLVAREVFPPATDMHTGFQLTYKGKHPVDINACIMMADDNFIPLYHIRLLAGSPLRNTDTLSGFVVNEAMTRVMGLTDPGEAVGKMLYGGDHGVPIIGVVADFHEYSYHEAIVPIAMMDFSGPPKNNIAVRLNTRLHQLGQLQTVLGRIEQAWKKVYPGTPFNYRFLDDAIAAMYTKEQKTAVLMNTAMALTIFISCMGLFGLATFTAGQRAKEVGIRKVLGATVIDITLMLSGSFARLIAIAVLIASPVAWYLMNRWLQDFAYRIPIGGMVFFFAGGIALSIAMLTIGFQTLKLAFTNPTEILRTE